jgi:hypothetical protein
VRPRRNFLELCVFLGRTLKAPQRRSDRASKSKVYHIIHIKHRDEVEAPIADWLREAYELSDLLASKAGKACAKSKHKLKSKRISPRREPTQSLGDLVVDQGTGVPFCGSECGSSEPSFVRILTKQ